MPASRSKMVRLSAAAIVALLATSAAAAEPEPIDAKEIERLYVEGQSHYEKGDFLGAAGAWEEALERIPESTDNRSLRESILLNVLDARLTAHRRLVQEHSEQHRDEDLEPLRSGLRRLKRYREEVAEAYGTDAGVSPALEERSTELEEALRRAEQGPDEAEDEDDTYFPACLTPCLRPMVEPEVRRGCGRRSNEPLVGFVVLLPFANPRRRRQVIEDVSDALPPDVVERLRSETDD